MGPVSGAAGLLPFFYGFCSGFLLSAGFSFVFFDQISQFFS
jgi:hypothetical protein